MPVGSLLSARSHKSYLGTIMEVQEHAIGVGNPSTKLCPRVSTIQQWSSSRTNWKGFSGIARPEAEGEEGVTAAGRMEEQQKDMMVLSLGSSY